MTGPYNGPAGTPAESAVTAYCAPGLKNYAERLLADAGETYRELIEHPWMAGRTDVILATDPTFPLPPFTLDQSPWANPWLDVLADLRTIGPTRGPHPSVVIYDEPPPCYTAGIGITIHGPGCTCGDDR